MKIEEAIKLLEIQKPTIGCKEYKKPLMYAYEMAIQALEEIQQYRAIGTLEELHKKMEELERWHTDKINENIKNPFAYTSTYICHNCDHKDEYIEELESEVAEYKSIGTVEEFKALKEKRTAKSRRIVAGKYFCPECGRTAEMGYCKACGQNLY